jgi:octaheme c-type cytochrome (tetrathionate reductase family)
VSHPGATVALAVELLLGIVAPFVLLLNHGVRRSAGWLFFSACLVIFGVILNRFNVFLVAYEPPYLQKAYFPSVGEISMTIAIVCSILFCYRFMVTFFPILPGHAAAEEKAPSLPADEGTEAVSPFWTWVVRGVALASVFGFVFLYVVVHKEAIQATELTVKEVQRVTAERPPVRTGEKGPAYPHRPSGYKNFYLIDSAVLRAQSDDYEPVAFSHRIHDELVGGDCGVCHHRYVSSPEDRVGTDIREIHASMDVKLGGPCSACHDNMADRPPQSCMHCHGLPNEADDPSRIGLKGAYHRQCIGCHERQPKPTTAPTDCAGCHHPWTPNHGALVSFKGKPGPQDVTRECLRCHAKVGQDILSTAHWNWKGRSPTIVGQEHQAAVALASMINSYYITIAPTAPQSAVTHIGYGRMDGTFDFKDPAKIDCLVCHDSTGTYRKVVGRAGQPDPSTDLAVLAMKVGRPGRRECGSCHFGVGGAPNAAHGDLEPALAANADGLDMHMGTLNMRCQDCHTTTAHRIAGMSFSAPAVEGRVGCEKCHGLTPHGVAGPLSRHLDDHVRAVACETCHIPSFAHVAPTLVRRDFSVAGQDRPEKTDAYGRPSYDKRLGSLAWARDVTPVYLWFDGTRSATLVGEKIDPSKPVVLNAPVGEKRMPEARIFPFKVISATLPYDKTNKVLAVPELQDGFWTHFDMSRAIADGMKKAGVAYSGEYGFVETTMYSGIHHEVVPAKKALGCADCHEASAITCTRCHQKAQQMDLPEHRRKVYPEVKERLDFKALGYPGDPARVGGRFYISIGRGKPPA